MAKEKVEPEVFERGTLTVKVERSVERGRAFLSIGERSDYLAAEELEALGRFLINSARRLSR